MYFDDKFENNIVAVNVTHFLSQEERNIIEKELNDNDIGILFFEKRGFQASLFETIAIYINEHLTELLICGLLMPAAYDVLKTTILRIAKSLSGVFQRKTKAKNEAMPSMELKIGNAKIVAPIPNNLSDRQFSKYMDTLQKTLKIFSDNKAKSVKGCDSFIVEYTDETTDMTIKSVLQYGRERAVKQQKNEK